MRGQKTITKAFLLSFVLCFLFQDAILAQRWKLRRYEVGGGIGLVQVFGDIGGTSDENNWYGLKDISLKETRIGITSLARYKIQPRYSVKSTFNFGLGKGSDEPDNYKNRTYKTMIFEFTGQFEYYLLQEEKGYRSSGIYSRRGMLNNYNHYALYGFAGVGLAYTRSKHTYDVITETDIYRTGGNFAPVIPFGLGVKLVIDSRISLNTEFGYRYPFSDFIEGYSNINSKYNDTYYFLTMAVTYRLKTTPRNKPAFIDKQYRKYGY